MIHPFGSDVLHANTPVKINSCNIVWLSTAVTLTEVWSLWPAKRHLESPVLYAAFRNTEATAKIRSKLVDLLMPDTILTHNFDFFWSSFWWCWTCKVVLRFARGHRTLWAKCSGRASFCAEQFGAWVLRKLRRWSAWNPCSLHVITSPTIFASDPHHWKTSMRLVYRRLHENTTDPAESQQLLRKSETWQCSLDNCNSIFQSKSHGYSIGWYSYVEKRGFLLTVTSASISVLGHLVYRA